MLYEVITPNMGWNLLLPLFAASILGGIGKPYGAILGGYVIGIATGADIQYGRDLRREIAHADVLAAEVEVLFIRRGLGPLATEIEQERNNFV